MSSVKQAAVSGVVAFGPRSLLAVGTAAGSIDHDFSNDSQLEIYALDFKHAGRNLQRLGNAPSSDRFHCLSWGTLRSDLYHPEAIGHTRTYLQPESWGQDGIIAAGLANGVIEIWDPAKLAAGKGEAARITKLDKHKGPVKGLQFNVLSPHLLASAGIDGELAIWDLSDPQKPKQYPPLKEGHQPGPKAEISNLAWNPKIAHILATCTTVGSVTVWDLKKQATIMSLNDNQGRMKSCSSVAWNPTNSTQIVAACDHHLSPTLHRWDLRSPNMPSELLGHDQGVTSVSWCKHEASYLLSSGKDGKVMLWDAPQGRALGSFNAGVPSEFAQQVRWSPYSPGLFAIATSGGPDGHGKVSLHTVASFTAPAAPAEEGAVAAAPSPLLHAPEWMKRPAGACFGFGGKLAAFKTVRTESGGKSVVTSISQVVTEKNLVEQSGSFEQAVMSNDKAALADFCASKASQAAPEERVSWAFMQVLFQDDSRSHLLAHLGFQDILPQAAGAGEDASLAAHAESLQLTSPRSAPGTSPPQHMPEANGNALKEEDGESFFENLQQAEPSVPQVSRQSTLSPRPATSEEHHAEAGESEAEIQRALYVGNYEAAVNTCLQADRMADALIIASVGGSYLFEKAQKEYMRRAPRPYMKIVSAIMSHDLTGLVKSRPLDRWKETLALLCAYSEGGEFHALCDLLAKRLAGAGLPGPATLAWICAANVDKAVRQWTADLKASSPEPSAEALQNLMERAVVLGHGANQEETSPALATLVSQYASILAAQGRMGAALQYLSLVPGDVAPDVAVLKDRIHRSGAPDVYTSPEPMFPFIAEDVAVDPTAAQQSSAYSQSAAYTSQPAAYLQTTQAAPAPAGSTGTDYYSRNQYHVHGAYTKPSGPSYDSSSYGNASYSSAQAPQAGYSTGYDSSYSGYGQSAAYQSAPQATAPVPHFAPQTRTTMQPGSASYGSQMGGGYGAAPSVPASQPPAYAPQPSRAAPQPPKPAWQPQAAPAAAAPPAAQAQPAWQQPAAQPAPVPRAPSWAPQQAPEQQNMFQPARSASSVGLPPVATQQAPLPAFVPRSSPSQTPSGFGQQPSPFGQAPQSGPITPPKPAPPPAPTGPPANANVTNVDTSKAPQSGPMTPLLAPSEPPANANVADVDTSKVPAEYQVIVSSLRDLVHTFITNAGMHPGKKREADDNSKKVGVLFWRINAGELSPEVLDKLRALVSAIQSGNGPDATSIQMDLTNNHWNEVGSAMTALKRMIKQTMR